MATRSTSQKTLCDVVYNENASFSNGRLPVQKSVIEAMLYLMRPARTGQAQRTITDASRMIAYALTDHWTFCNIHTLSINAIATKVEKLYQEFVKKCANTKRKTN